MLTFEPGIRPADAMTSARESSQKTLVHKLNSSFEYHLMKHDTLIKTIIWPLKHEKSNDNIQNY